MCVHVWLCACVCGCGYGLPLPLSACFRWTQSALACILLLNLQTNVYKLASTFLKLRLELSVTLPVIGQFCFSPTLVFINHRCHFSHSRAPRQSDKHTQTHTDTHTDTHRRTQTPPSTHPVYSPPPSPLESILFFCLPPHSRCVYAVLADPVLFLPRFVMYLQLGDKRHEVGRTAIRIVSRMKRDWLHVGRRPAGICGAALLLAARLHGYARTQTEIVHAVKVCSNTVRKRLDEFADTPSAKLTMDEFLSIDLEGEADPPAFKKSQVCITKRGREVERERSRERSRERERKRESVCE